MCFHSKILNRHIIFNWLFAWATESFHQDITHHLSFSEWCTIITQHPTTRPSHPLNGPLTDWHTYSPTLIQEEISPTPTPSQYISQFRDLVRLKPTSSDTTHVLIPRVRFVLDNDIMTILDIYTSALILTIEGSFKPLVTHHVYLPHQPHHPTTAHAAVSVTITAINNSHLTKQWMDIPTIPLLSRVQPLPTAYTRQITSPTTLRISWHGS